MLFVGAIGGDGGGGVVAIAEHQRNRHEEK